MEVVLMETGGRSVILSLSSCGFRSLIRASLASSLTGGGSLLSDRKCRTWNLGGSGLKVIQCRWSDAGASGDGLVPKSSQRISERRLLVSSGLFSTPGFPLSCFRHT